MCSIECDLRLATQNNQIIELTYIVDRACKTETLLDCRPYTCQNSLTFYYNAVFVLLHLVIDIFLFSFYKGSKELSDVRFKQAAMMIISITGQAIQVEVEKLVLL